MTAVAVAIEKPVFSFTHEKSYLRRVILSCMIGNALEWYDFALYGYFATIIGQLFFPTSSQFASLMATFGIFAAGFIMRPLGGIIFGYIGDKIGRKSALMWSIYLMAIPTALIGLLPTYEQIGWIAPTCLTLIRLAQGLSMGGEFTGSMIFVVEHAENGKRGFYGSLVVLSLFIGLLVGSTIATLTFYFLEESQVVSWGWRIPFLLSVVGGFIGTFMRKAVHEPEQFEKAKKQNKENVTPLKELFTFHSKTIVLVIFMELTLSVGFFVIFAFISNYLSALLEFDKSTSMLLTTISVISAGAIAPLAGWVSDRVGRKPVLIAGSLGFVLLSYPLFLSFQDVVWYMPVLAQTILGLFMGIFFSTIPAMLVELFPTNVRYSGLSIAHSLSMAIFGGSAPFLATWFIQATGNQAAPGLYLAIAALMSMVACFFLKDRFKENLQ